jgi:hypothetical protein
MALVNRHRTVALGPVWLPRRRPAAGVGRSVRAVTRHRCSCRSVSDGGLRATGRGDHIGELCLEVRRTTLRVMPKNHSYEPSSRALFASDTWAMVAQPRPEPLDRMRARSMPGYPSTQHRRASAPPLRMARERRRQPDARGTRGPPLFGHRADLLQLWRGDRGNRVGRCRARANNSGPRHAVERTLGALIRNSRASGRGAEQ